MREEGGGSKRETNRDDEEARIERAATERLNCRMGQIVLPAICMIPSQQRLEIFATTEMRSPKLRL